RTGATTLFALNRSVTDDLDLTVSLRGLGDGLSVVGATQLHDPDLKAINSKAAPDAVAPQPLEGVVLTTGGGLTARLKPQSWNVIRLARG
ncbi:MAG: Alpha-N-arabinofuranosidase, partial [Caulobacter sp.]|nr:Alpha-N-arabinofuranosidase [Caulobacter sp.]